MITELRTRLSRFVIYVGTDVDPIPMPRTGAFRYNTTTGQLFLGFNDQWLLTSGSGGGAVAWGDITGDVNDQTDLIAAVLSAVAEHEAASNPHPTYLTQAEGDGLYAALGAPAAAVAAHEAAGDPHAQYLLAAEGNAAYQPLDADLTTLAASITAFGHSLVDDANSAAARTTLGLVIGTDVQAQDAELAALAGLTSAADRLPYFTGSGTAALAVFTGAARNLLDDVDAAAQRATIGAAATAHSHIIADVTGLQAALDLLAPLVHVHAATDITSGVLAADRLASGSASQFLRRNAANTALEFATLAGGGDMLAANNLSDLANFQTARANLFPSGAITLVGANGALFGAGSASANSWPKLTPGTLLTTPEAGALELDANCLYATTDAGNRGYVPIVHFIRADATRTFTSNTTQQAIFNNPTNGTLTLETGTYYFEGLIAMTAMSATSGNGKFSILGAGTATLGAILWDATGRDAAAEATGGAVGGSWHIIATQTGVDIITAATGTAMCFRVKGTFEVTGAGTIIPSFAQTTAAAAVVSIGSFMRIERIGSTTAVAVGQWT